MADNTKQMTMQDQRAEDIPKVDRCNFYTNFIVLHTIVTLKQHTQLDQQYRKYKLKKPKQLLYPHQEDLLCIILFQKRYTDVKLENQAHNTHARGDHEVKKKKKIKRFDSWR